VSARSTSVREHRFPLTDTPRSIDVRNAAGSVTVRAVEEAAEVVVRLAARNPAAEEVLDRVDLFVTGSAVRVAVPERRLTRTPELAVEVLTPPGAAVTVRAASAEVDLHGRLGATELTTASGDASVEHCTDLQARTASGDVRLGVVDARTVVSTASGDVRLEAAGGPVDVRTASGDVTIGDAALDAAVSTASGDITVGRVRRGTVQLKTVSADATVGVERGLRVWLDVQSVAGRLSSDLDDEGPTIGAGSGDRPADVTVLLRSVSGDLRLRRATPRPPQPPAPPAPPAD
jgi:Putative adhesin